LNTSKPIYKVILQRKYPDIVPDIIRSFDSEEYAMNELLNLSPLAWPGDELIIKIYQEGNIETIFRKKFKP
jgi:hypothetical protein